MLLVSWLESNGKDKGPEDVDGPTEKLLKE